MANTDKVLSIPNDEVNSNDLTVITGGGAWAYSSWYKVLNNLAADINIYSIAFQLTATPTVDTAEQYLLEIGVGSLNSATTIIQLPYSMKSDTAVGIFQDSVVIFLPEPRLVTSGQNILIRVACDTASRTINGVKIMYTSTRNLWVPQVYPENYKRVSGGGSINAGGVI